MKYRILFIVVLLLKGFYGNSQIDVDAQELVRIAEAYRNGSMSFQVNYTITDCNYPDSLTQTDSFQYNTSFGRTYIYNDSVEMLQGREYFVYVDKSGGLMAITPQRTESKSIFDAPLLDSFFLATQTTGIGINLISGEPDLRRLSLSFHPNSNYASYMVTYNVTDGLILSIQYRVRNRNSYYDTAPDRDVCVMITFNNYEDVTPNAALFNENRYFYRLNGEFYPQPDWEGYTIEY